MLFQYPHYSWSCLKLARKVITVCVRKFSIQKIISLKYSHLTQCYSIIQRNALEIYLITYINLKNTILEPDVWQSMLNLCDTGTLYKSTGSSRCCSALRSALCRCTLKRNRRWQKHLGSFKLPMQETR